MMLSREDRMEISKETYARTLTARSHDGESCELLRELSFPPEPKTSGVIASIRVEGIQLDEFVNPKEVFRFFTISRGGVNTNRAAIRVLFTEIHGRRALLYLAHIREARTVNNSPKWVYDRTHTGSY